jgi:hypothetical protein
MFRILLIILLVLPYCNKSSSPEAMPKFYYMGCATFGMTKAQVLDKCGNAFDYIFFRQTEKLIYFNPSCKEVVLIKNKVTRLENCK